MRSTTYIELKDAANDGAESIKAEVLITPAAVFVSVKDKDGYERACVSLEHYDGEIVGYTWDDENMDNDPVSRDSLASIPLGELPQGSK